MYRFYSPDIAQTLTLSAEESAHCARVLRLTDGDLIEVADGNGNLHTCRITEAHPKHTTVQITATGHIQPHWGASITIAFAPTKSLDRTEWMLEKCTEMGADRFIPLLTRYSERKELKTERLRKILIAAMKQSLKATLPQLDEMTPIRQVTEAPFNGHRYIAYCDKTIPRTLLAQHYDPGIDTLIMIGPEGDFSHEEITQALQAGFIPISLGDSRLRTETAATVACATCHAIKQLHQPANPQ